MGANKNRTGSKKAMPLVLATVKPYTRNTLPDYTIASYKCDCGHRGAVQASLAKAHCSQCGGGVSLAKTVATANVIRVEKSSNPISLECATCNKHNMMTVATAMGFKGKVHCSACGEGLTYDTSEIAELDDDVDLDHNTPTGADDLSDTVGDHAKTQASMDGDDEVGNLDDIEDAEDNEDTEEASFDDDDEDIEDLDGTTADADEDESDEDEDDYLGGDAADNEDGETDDEDFDDEDEGESALASVKPTPILATLKEKTLARSRLVKDGDRLHIFAGNHCIATAKATAKNEKIFAKQTYANLIEDSLAKAGVVATIKEFGFTTASIKVSKAKALESTVASIRQKAEANLASKVKRHADRFSQALQTAAVGFNRDAFTATANPLKEAVYNTLVGLNIEPVTAALKTQQIFAASGDDYAQSLITKAHELAALSDAGLNEMSTTFASLAVPVPNLVAVASEQDEDEPFEEDYLDDEQPVTTASRLDNPMRQSATASVADVTGGFGMFSVLSK